MRIETATPYAQPNVSTARGRMRRPGQPQQVPATPYEPVQQPGMPPSGPAPGGVNGGAMYSQDGGAPVAQQALQPAPVAARQARGFTPSYMPPPVPRSVITAQPIMPPGGNAPPVYRTSNEGASAGVAPGGLPQPQPFTGSFANSSAGGNGGAMYDSTGGSPVAPPAPALRPGTPPRPPMPPAGHKGVAASMRASIQAAAVKNWDATYGDPLSEVNLKGQWGDELAADKARQQQSETRQNRGLDTLERTGRTLEGFQPTESASFDPSRLERLRATNTEDWAPTEQESFSTDPLTNFRSAATEGVDTGALDNFSPTATQALNTDALKRAGTNAGATIRGYLANSGAGGAGGPVNAVTGGASFDPQEAINTYARGAAGASKFVLNDALDSATNSAAAGGRLDSGLFDRDKGRVIQNVGEQLNNSIAQQAVEGARIKAGLLQNADTLGTQASIETGRQGLEREGLRSAEARDSAGLGVDALTNALGLDSTNARASDDLRLTAATSGTDARLRRASTMDNNKLNATTAAADVGLRRAAGIDSGRQERANYLDTARQTNTRDTIASQQQRGEFLDSTQLDAMVKSGQLSQSQAELLAQLNGQNIDRTGDRIASERDRITDNSRYAAEQRAAERQSKRNLWGGIAGAGLGMVGTVLGGPIGGAIGAKIGGSVGRK